MVLVAAGQEASVQIALSVGRLSRVAGTVVDSSGKPLANAMTTLQPSTGGFVSGVTNGLTGPDGAFAIANVAPGDYTFKVKFRPPNAEQPTEATQSVTVE